MTDRPVCCLKNIMWLTGAKCALLNEAVRMILQGGMSVQKPAFCANTLIFHVGDL